MATKVRLYKGVPLFKDNHVLSFRDISRSDYFSKYEVLNRDTYYVKIDKGFIELSELDNNLNRVNYCSIEQSGSIYYAFVDSLEYISDRNVKINFTIDYWTTYYGKPRIQGMIEREHSNYNNKNITPEPIGLADGVNTSTTDLSDTHENFKMALITTTTDLTNPKGFGGGTKGTGNHPSLPYNFYLVGANDYSYLIDNQPIGSLEKFSDIYSKSEDFANKIVSITIIDRLPFQATVTKTAKSAFNISTSGLTTIEIDGMRPLGLIMTCRAYEKIFTIPLNKLSGDMVKLSYSPFKEYDLITTYGTLKINPENVTGSDLKVKVTRTVEPTPSEIIEVVNYRNMLGYTNSVSGNYGVNIPVVTEQLSAYLQSQQNSLLEGGSALAMGALGVGLVVASGGTLAPALIGMTASIAGSGINQMMNMEKQKQSPNSLNGTQGTLIPIVASTKPVLYEINQPSEYIDKFKKYLKVYGWQVNDVGTPNLTTRKAWNFVKMSEVKVVDSIPQKATEEFTRLFIEGVTIWHSDIGNYEQENSLR